MSEHVDTLRDNPLLGAIARGWCHAANAHKEMDADLALAIAAEVAALTPTPAGEGVNMLCIECGHPTMHMGNVCFPCSKARKAMLAAAPQPAQPSEAAARLANAGGTAPDIEDVPRRQPTPAPGEGLLPLPEPITEVVVYCDHDDHYHEPRTPYGNYYTADQMHAYAQQHRQAPGEGLLSAIRSLVSPLQFDAISQVFKEQAAYAQQHRVVDDALIAESVRALNWLASYPGGGAMECHNRLYAALKALGAKP